MYDIFVKKPYRGGTIAKIRVIYYEYGKLFKQIEIYRVYRYKTVIGVNYKDAFIFF